MTRRPVLALLATLLLSSATLLADQAHTFRYHADPKSPPKTVHVAGGFNGWSTVATPMTDVGNGVFEAKVNLAEGVHHYKFVLNGGQWVNDPKYSDKELEQGDNYGGVNSAVLIGPDARKLPAPPKNGIRAEAVFFSPERSEDLNVVTDSMVRVSLRTQAGDATGAAVMVRGANDPEWKTFPLAPASAAMGLDRYAGVAEFKGSPVKLVFRLDDGRSQTYFASGQAYPADAKAAQARAYSVDGKPKFTTPDWAKEAVWYQVFPERFRNGDKANDPDGSHRWQSKWFTALPGEAPGEENFYKGKGNVWWRRYGGDVQGLRQSLPYLRSLGVNAIYLNPVFEAESMHKYDASDFRHIDDNFGVKGDLAKVQGETDDPATWKWTESDKVFLEFVDEAHKQGFKVVIDGVFNHVGRAHPFFQDVLKNGKKSKYADWFDVRDWNEPIKYIAWDRGGEPTSDGALPVFKKDPQHGLVEGPRKHIHAITKRWLAPDGDPSRGVDGWRLDVPGDIPHPFWVEWRKIVKETKPDAYISGEIWDWAQAWLQGDQFDAVMNYRFADAAQQFFVNRQKAIRPSEFASKLAEMVNAYPLQVSLVQMNLFDSHDTDRLASMFVNPDVAYDAANRIQDNNPNYNPAKPGEQEWTRLKQAVTCQMTFLGAPMTYYGDEAGMWGPDDPSNRQPMVWKDLQPYDDPQVAFRQDLFDHYRRLIAIRHTLRPLRWGYYRTLATDDQFGTVAYARTIGDQAVYVVLNRSNERRTVILTVNDQQPLINWLDPKSAQVKQSGDARPTVVPANNAHTLRPANGQVRVTLEPYGSAVLSSSPGAEP